MGNHQYTFRARWCGNCGHAYAVQIDRREEKFASAQAHMKGGDHSMVVVTHCVECNAVLDQAWLDNSYTEKPDTQRVHGRNDDERADLDGPVL